MALQAAEPDHRQHDRADGDVEAVEAGEHEEGRAVDAGVQLQVQLLEGVHILDRLADEEGHAEQDGGAEPHEQLAAVVGDQVPVREGHRHARRSAAGSC